MIKPNSLRTASVRLQNLWHDIWRQIQMYIEHSPMTNGEAALSLTLGDVVYCSGNRTVKLAVGTSLPPANAIGVIDDSTTAPGAKCLVATSGYQLVKCIDGLAPTEGAALYVSDTAGRAQLLTGTCLFIIGQIADASMYVGVPGAGYYPYVKALINNGCCVGRGQ